MKARAPRVARAALSEEAVAPGAFAQGQESAEACDGQMEPKGVFQEKHKVPGKIVDSVIFRVFRNSAEHLQTVTGNI